MKKVLFTLLFSITLFTTTGCEILNNKIYGCNNCVFSHYQDIKKVGDGLSDYKNEYSTLNYNVFLGHKIDKNNKIVAGYVCGKENNIFFCLQSNSNGSKYKTNKEILDKVYDKKQCKEKKYGSQLFYSCSGNISANISSDGTNYLSVSKSNECYVKKDGEMYCYYA